MAIDEKMIEEMRAQMADFQAKIADLEGLKKTSDGERKAAADLIATLKAEVDAIRGDLATFTAPKPPKAEGGSLLDFFFGEDK